MLPGQLPQASSAPGQTMGSQARWEALASYAEEEMEMEHSGPDRNVSLVNSTMYHPRDKPKGTSSQYRGVLQ